VAVPEKGVNNSFDYPLGLSYLLFVGPFFYMLAQNVKKGELPIMPVFAVVYWLSWWLGSQQSRFLFVPLALIFVTVSSAWGRLVKRRVAARSSGTARSARGAPSKVLMGVLLASVLLNGLSIFRAHRRDFGLSPVMVLRDQDRLLLEMNKSYRSSGKKDAVYVDFHDVAFAQFPVMVTSEKAPYVLALQRSS
jgi:hypothetical protein